MSEFFYGTAGFSDVLVALMVVAGTGLALIGNLGLIRLNSFYERVHAPTLGATLGAGFILIAAVLHFWDDGKPLLVPVLIALFITLTTPIALIMLVRAALFRDRIEKTDDVPKDA